MRARLAGLGYRLALVTLSYSAWGLTVRSGMGQEATKASRPAPSGPVLPGSRPGRLCRVRWRGCPSRAWEKTAAYRLLTETTTGAMLEQSAARLLDMVLTRTDGGVRGGSGPGRAGRAHAALRMRSGDQPAGARGRRVASPWSSAARRAGRPARSSIGCCASASIRVPGQDGREAGRAKVNVLGNPARGGKAWWTEGDDLVVSLSTPTGVDAIIAALDGGEPNALEHPTRMALARQRR